MRALFRPFRAPMLAADSYPGLRPGLCCYALSGLRSMCGRLTVAKPKPMEPETDPRFPSGRWIGFFLQKIIPPGKHPMELHLNFSHGAISGEGRDWVGLFIL